MASVNKVIIVGNLGADPDVRTFDNGGKIANVSIATSERWNDRQTGEPREHTEWHRVVFNNRLADIVEQYLRKGSSVYVEGSLRTRKWQDQQGIDRYSTEIRADSMQMLGSRNNNQDGGNYQSGGYQGNGYQGNNYQGGQPKNQYQNRNNQNTYQHQAPQAGYDSDYPYGDEQGMGEYNNTSHNHQPNTQGGYHNNSPAQPNHFGTPHKPAGYEKTQAKPAPNHESNHGLTPSQNVTDEEIPF